MSEEYWKIIFLVIVIIGVIGNLVVLYMKNRK